MRIHTVYWPLLLATLSTADIIRAKTTDLFKLDDTCKNSKLDNYFDQATTLLNRCIKAVELLRGGSADMNNRKTRNKALAAHNAFGTSHPDRQGSQVAKRDTRDKLDFVNARLLEMGSYLEDKRNAQSKEPKDYCACDASAYSKVTIARLIDSSAATVLTTLATCKSIA